MALAVKNPAANAGDVRDPWVQTLGREDPLERARQPTPVYLPRESRGQRILVAYNPWGHKESDMTEAT